MKKTIRFFLFVAPLALSVFGFAHATFAATPTPDEIFTKEYQPSTSLTSGPGAYYQSTSYVCASGGSTVSADSSGYPPGFFSHPSYYCALEGGFYTSSYTAWYYYGHIAPTPVPSTPSSGGSDYVCSGGSYFGCASINISFPTGAVLFSTKSCTSSANSCYAGVSGFENTSGTCDAVTPPLPAGYGTSCKSVANSCGMTNTGTISCSGACSATTPADSLCPTAGGADIEPTLGTLVTLSGAAIANQAVTLSARFTNYGTLATTGAFPDLFEIYPGTVAPTTFAQITANGAVISVSSPALAANEANTVSVSHAFPAGQWLVRACANTNTANINVVTESNYGNNCGTWTPVSVGTVCYGGGCSGANSGPNSPGANSSCQYPGVTQPSANPYQCCSTTPGVCPALSPLPTVLLSATPDTILAGSSSLLTWNSQNAASCTGSPTDFAKGATSNLVGAPVSPSTDTTYSITCTGAFGNQGTSNTTVSVIAVNLSLTASPTSVRKGEQSTITWSAAGQKITACSITGPGLASSALSGVSLQTINTESTYTLSCAAGLLHPSTSATVKLIPGFREI